MEPKYVTYDNSLLSSICSDLKTIGCCSRCILRYVGLADMYYFRGDTQEMNQVIEQLCQKDKETFETKESDKDEGVKMETNENQEDSSSEIRDTAEQNGTETTKNMVEKESKSICIICLGILQQFSDVEFINKIKSETEEFTFTTYMCSLALPVCVIVREISLGKCFSHIDWLVQHCKSSFDIILKNFKSLLFDHYKPCVHAVMLYLKDKYPKVYGGKAVSSLAELKSVWKWRNGPVLKEMMEASFENRSVFNIIMNFTYKNSDKECSFLLDSDTDTFRKRKQDKRYKNKSKKSIFTLYNNANVSKAIEQMSDSDFKRLYQCPPLPPTCDLFCDVKCQHDNVFVAGRYNKYCRTLSQTPWLIEGVRKSESSVEELLCTEINKHFKPTEQRFSSSGREDVDVLMLGNGRPFVLELVNPRCREFSQEQITAIQQQINESTKNIKCSDLQIVTREETEKLKEGEIDKVKQYSALCWCKEKIGAEKLQKLNELKDLTILQKTPIRVLHRRPLATRDKIIHSMSVKQQDDQHFKVDLSTQAGTYIKEFVHGDFGRTKPNMTSILGVECDILELDVTAVELDWPKKIVS